MPHDKQIYPYVIVGDGIIATARLKQVLAMFLKVRNPIPVYFYAKTLEAARVTAHTMLEWHETIVIAKIEEVVK